MLTSYDFVPEYLRNDVSQRGYKTFVFGAPSDELRGRWLQSKQGPGFHIFVHRHDAEKYAAGLDFSVVEEVNFRRMLSYGWEGDGQAVTAEWLYINKREGDKEHD